MAKYLKLFMVALFATLTVSLTSCGDDEPSQGKEDKDYTLKINDVTYYYGCDYLWAGMSGMEMTELWSHFSTGTVNSQKVISLTLSAQNIPIKMFDEDGEAVVNQGASKMVRLFLDLSYFDPQTTKKGTELSIYCFSPNTDRWEYSQNNELWIENPQTDSREFNGGINSTTEGTVKFVSFQKDANEGMSDYLTLEFNNLTFYKKGAVQNNGFTPLDKSVKYVISGTVIFDSSI